MSQRENTAGEDRRLHCAQLVAGIEGLKDRRKEINGELRKLRRKLKTADFSQDELDAAQGDLFDGFDLGPGEFVEQTQAVA